MTATIRSEWIKLRTVRMNAVLVAIAVGLPLVVTTLTTLLAGTNNFDDAGSLASLVVSTSIVTGILLGVVGAAGITSEFGFNTIRPTFAATPKRTQVVIAKAIVTVAVAIVVQLVVLLSSLALGQTILATRDVTVDVLGSSDLRPAMFGIVVFAGILSLLGLGVGLLLRSTPAAVAFLILWPLLIENLIGSIFVLAGADGATKWLPYQAGLGLASTSDPGADSLGRVGGGLLFFGFALLVTIAGTIVTQRRDA